MPTNRNLKQEIAHKIGTTDKSKVLDEIVSYCSEKLATNFMVVILKNSDIKPFERKCSFLSIPFKTFLGFENPGQYVPLQEALGELSKFSSGQAPIVITNEVGGRGIDYKFKNAAEVLIGFLPSSKRDFVQFKG